MIYKTVKYIVGLIIFNPSAEMHTFINLYILYYSWKFETNTSNNELVGIWCNLFICIQFPEQKQDNC